MLQKNKNNRAGQKGFTILELLTVVAIITLLAAMALPQFLDFRWKAVRSEAVVVIKSVATAQDAFIAAHDRFAAPDYNLGLAGPYHYGFSTYFEPECVRDLHQRLGLGDFVSTPQGYNFSYEIWTFEDPDFDSFLAPPSGVNQFYVTLTKDFDSDFVMDVLGYQAGGNLDINDLPGPYQYPEKEIVVIWDDILNVARPAIEPPPPPGAGGGPWSGLP